MVVELPWITNKNMTTAASKLLREPWLLVCIVKFYCSWAFRYFTNLIKNFHRRAKLLGPQQFLWWKIWSETESWLERSKWLRWVSIRWKEAQPQKFPFLILFFDWQILQRIQKWTVLNVEQWFFSIPNCQTISTFYALHSLNIFV